MYHPGVVLLSPLTRRGEFYLFPFSNNHIKKEKVETVMKYWWWWYSIVGGQ